MTVDNQTHTALLRFDLAFGMLCGTIAMLGDDARMEAIAHVEQEARLGTPVYVALGKYLREQLPVGEPLL